MGNRRVLARATRENIYPPNTFIGGVGASTILTPADIVSRTTLLLVDIENFSITNNEVSFYTSKNYDLLPTAFYLNSEITYFIDIDRRVKTQGAQAFRDCVNLTFVLTLGITSFSGGYNYRNSPKLRFGIFPNLLSVPNSWMYEDSHFNAINYYIPKVINLGSTDGNDGCFNSIVSGSKIVVDSSRQTNNAGLPDGDLTYAISRGVTVNYVTYASGIVEAVDDLATVAKYGSAITIGWTAPISTNPIDFYLIFDGFKFLGYTSSLTYTQLGLEANTPYSFRIMVIDVYGNVSDFGNILTETTNSAYTIPTASIKSYYNFNGNVLDIAGIKNGIATSLSYASGLIDNCASFNGTSSKVLLPINTNPYFDFTVVMLFKVNSLILNGARVIELNNNSGAYFTVSITASNISVSVYDGVVRTISTSDYNLSNWVVIAVTVENGNNYKLYVNSVLAATYNSLGALAEVSNKGNYIGAERRGDRAYLNGNINAVAILDKVASHIEISEMSNKLLKSKEHLI